MSSFSKKERYFATILNAFPRLKYILKIVYIYLNALLYWKKYVIKFQLKEISNIQHIYPNEESFFGYYDKSPINRNGIIISHVSKEELTKHTPKGKRTIQIILSKENSKETINVGETSSYNWQQGARAHWLSDDLLIYNDFDKSMKKYVSKVFSLADNMNIKTFDYPVQDSYNTQYFLSINYRRILSLNPDYGYRNQPSLTSSVINKLDNDGIWKIDYSSGKSILLHTLQSIVDCGYKDMFASCKHIVNHIMISPDGKSFIFIHRFYHDKRRIDRLIYSNFTSLRVLLDFGMVSHYCWINNNTFGGYFNVKNRPGFYFYNISTQQITECDEINNLILGDGHPCCYKNWIVFDTYPDRSRMQKLILYNIKTKQIIPILDLFHSVHYMYQTRCDLHPRFSIDGKQVFFDTVYTGKRQHCRIDVSNIVK
jgi:hypothetical protein